MKQPEALCLADELESVVHEYDIDRLAAAELRRLQSLNQELVDTLKYIEAQTHLGHIHDTASSALTKARGTE
jgi:hypothetical protein